jgi:hypothetical protein
MDLTPALRTGADPMSIIDRIPASVQTDPGIHDDGLDHFEPTAEDLDDFTAYLAGRSDLDIQAVEPVPVELLEAPADDIDFEPWWASLPTDPEFLDDPIELGDEARPLPSASARYRVEVAGDPDCQDDGFNVVDSVTGYPVRWQRWFIDAQEVAAELERNIPRSRASWNPEADAIGRS